ncbi:site-specific integrase, partial [Acinetobacter gerneri]|nr:site-specific integrase [Acinetobacter gerneri]
MKQFKLFDDLQEQHLVSIFNDRQTIALQDMSKKIPKIVRFLVADKFDDKFINSIDNIWKFYYSGQTENLNFSKLPESETTLVKFFLIAFIQKNTPSHLSTKFYSFNFLVNHLKNNELEFN